MGLRDRLRALFLRADGDIGQLRGPHAVLAWTHKLPRVRLADARGAERGWFVGTVRALAPTVVAPLSLAPVVRARLRSARYVDRGSTVEYSREWEAGGDFALDDDDGAVARVSAGLVSLELAPRRVVGSSLSYDDIESVRDATREGRHRSPMISRSLGGAWLYEEFSVAPGDRVLLLGATRVAAAQPSEGAGSFRSTTNELVIEAAPDAMFLYLVSEPG